MARIRVRELKLTNFRNYPRLDLRLGKGITLIEGANGNGKTNLLESLHLMSIGRSPRASTERELVRTKAFDEIPLHAQIAGDISSGVGALRLQIDWSATSAATQKLAAPRIQKTFRVNGVPRRSADFVGLFKAVLFTAEDIRLTSGSPSVRRRYIDILISQMSREYLADALTCQRILTQRNRLLKSARGRTSIEGELQPWDVQLAEHAARIMSARARAIRRLDERAKPIHSQLSGAADPLRLTYVPSVSVGQNADIGEISESFLATAQSYRRREMAVGHSLIGPHRDDIAIKVGGVEVGTYASRGQARTVALAMRLGEARLLAESTGEHPVILLDDVMSELDTSRRRQVLERAALYEQALVTTAEPAQSEIFSGMSGRRIVVSEGRIISEG